jgi:hypothetical protein
MWMAEDTELQDRLAEAEAAHPGRNPRAVTYGGRVLIALQPTSGQIAAMARLGRSGRMDDSQRIANLLDIMELLLAEDVDKAWLANGMLGGEMDIGDADDDDTKPASALGLLRALTRAYAPEDNREGRRAAEKKARRVTG